MTIFIHQLKRLLRSGKRIVVMILVPTILTAFVVMTASSGSMLRIGIVDNDRTRLTAQLADELKTHATVEYISESRIQELLIGSSLNYVLSIDAGFTERLIAGEVGNVQGFRIEETNTSRPLQVNIEGLLNAALNVARVAQGDEERFYEGMEYYQTGSFTVSAGTVSEGNRDVMTAGIGFLILSILFQSSLTTLVLIKDKQERTLFRVLATPMSIRRYMFQTIASFYVVSLVQILGVLSLLQLVFHMDIAPIFGNLFVVLAAFAAVAVAFGVAVASASKTTRQAGIIASLLITPMGMLGGTFWPRELMPELFIRIGDFIPVTWAVKGASSIISGQGLGLVLQEISVLLLFALVFFLAGTWRKTDVCR